MRPVEFSDEEVIAAGEALVAAGRNVTGFALRQKVGGGNPSRLRQVWDEHVASKSVAEAEPVAELPVEVAEEVAAVSKALTERIAALASELNDKAVKAAERRVAEVIRTAGEQREQAERELADAAQTVEDLEGQLDKSREEIDDLEVRLGNAQSLAQEHAVELAQLRERLTSMEKAAASAAEQHAAELARLNAAREEERSRAQREIDELQGAMKDVQAEAGGLRQELATVRADAAAAEKVAQAEIVRSASVLDEFRKSSAKEAQRCADKLIAAHAERDEKKEDAARLRGEIDTLRSQNEKLMAALSGGKR